MPVSESLMNEIRVLYPWMTPDLLNAYETSWTEFEDREVALQQVRQSASYGEIFGGNYDPATGQVRMAESDYFASKANFDATLIGVGVNPDFFKDEWIEALEGEVSPAEMTSRIESVYDRVMDQSDAIRNYFAETVGIEMSDAAMVAIALKPGIEGQILNRQITMAEIGGEAAMSGFDLTQAMAKELFQAQLGRSQAAGLFGQAREDLPALSILARRHADPDDTFDLEEFITADVYNDPVQRRRIRRLVAQERSTFGNIGAQTEFARSGRGGITGLRQA